jgi:ketosteroid isomerase-like protein
VTSTQTEQAHKATVLAMWDALARSDFETLKSCLHPDVHYEDVPSGDPGARGPANVVKRLRIAWDHLARQEQITHRIAADGDLVFIDHTEIWTFKSGEKAQHRFCTMHELRGGKIAKWSDFWDMARFAGQFPKWFVEELAKARAEDFSGPPGASEAER